LLFSDNIFIVLQQTLFDISIVYLLYFINKNGKIGNNESDYEVMKPGGINNVGENGQKR
jgi:hypothetical protein